MNVMKCKDFRIRTKKYERYFFCKNKNKQITLLECENCSEFDFKRNKAIKRQSKKKVKLENSRFSIITNDLKHCYICTERGLKDVPKEDLHEVYGGSNRKRSIENGLVVPLCRKCHQDYTILKWLKKFVQLEYEENHTRDDFISLIGKSYL